MPVSPTRGLTRLIATLGLAALAGAGSAQEADTAAPSAAQAQSSGWSVQCNNNAEAELVCSAVMTLTSGEENQRIFSISLQEAPEAETPTLIMQLPFGLNLPRGIDLTIDEGETRTFEVNTCLQTGCFVAQPAPAALTDAMAAGETLTVAMEASSGGETRMSLSLQGFTKAFQRLQ
jgi:invasion protein IalB